MQELDEHNVLDYLREKGWILPELPATARQLSGGVSNVVLRIDSPAGDMVLKQSRAQLRTRDPWFSRLDRIYREMGILQLLQDLLPPGAVPRCLQTDHENYLFVMEAIAADHRVWKQVLLDGTADPAIAGQLGTLLASIHRQTWHRTDLAAEWGDLEIFIQLRIDPYYRHLAKVHPEWNGPLQRLIDETLTRHDCLVLADFSPKNILLTSTGITLVDFETGHYGDPAFDLGFFLSHLLLKTILHADRFDEYAALTTAFWNHYRAGWEPETALADELQRRTLPHLAACMAARIDATSKIDYLPQPRQQDTVRRFANALFFEPPQTWPQVLERLRQEIART